MFGAFLGGFELLLFLPLLMIGMLCTIFWIWMLIHALTNNGLRDMEKLIWVVVIVFTHFVGALIYFFIGRPKREQTSGA